MTMLKDNSQQDCSTAWLPQVHYLVLELFSKYKTEEICFFYDTKTIKAKLKLTHNESFLIK